MDMNREGRNRVNKAAFAGTFAVAGYAVSYLMYRFGGMCTVDASVFYILILSGIYYILKSGLYMEGEGGGECGKLLLIPAVLFATTVVTGIYLDAMLPFETMQWGDFLNYLILILGLTPLSGCMFAFIYRMMKKWAVNEKNVIREPQRGIAVFLISFAVIFCCWLLVWLAYYPGLWSYDPWQVNQVLNHDYNKHHPLIHTILLGVCYSVGARNQDCNSGVVLYDMIQMCIMSGIFAYVCVYLYRHHSGRIFRIITLLFYALFPVNSILAISPTKDVIFSGLAVLCLVLMLQLKEMGSGRKKWFCLTLLFGVVNLMLLFRNNAVYALVLFTGCVFLFMLYVWYDQRRCPGRYMYMCLFAVGCLISFRAADDVLTRRLDAKEGPVREKYSVSSQQFGRIYERLDASGQDEETRELITSYYDMEEGEYNPYLSDPMKRCLGIDRDGSEHDYVRNSIKLLFKYPLESLDAFLYLTEGAWYINDTSHAAIYGTGLESRLGYLLTDYKDGYGIVHESKLPVLENILERAFSANEYQKFPVMALLFSPALYFWILVVCTVGFLKMRNGYNFVMTGFLWCYFLTILAGPCILIRYMYPFLVCSPVLIGMLHAGMKES